MLSVPGPGQQELAAPPGGSGPENIPNLRFVTVLFRNGKRLRAPTHCASLESVSTFLPPNVVHTHTFLPTCTAGPNKCVATINIHAIASLLIKNALNGLSAVRAHQRDLIHVSSLREQTENILRSWFGKHLPCECHYLILIPSHIIDATLRCV